VPQRLRDGPDLRLDFIEPQWISTLDGGERRWLAPAVRKENFVRFYLVSDMGSLAVPMLGRQRSRSSTYFSPPASSSRSLDEPLAHPPLVLGEQERPW
jgi:hypothetical protein